MKFNLEMDLAVESLGRTAVVVVVVVGGLL